ncbi:hypothetical protein VTH06DRAFT_3763 [Thermothelomyces fergusii]
MEGGATTAIAPRSARGTRVANTEIGTGTSIGAKRSALASAASSGLATGRRPGPKRGTRFARVPRRDAGSLLSGLCFLFPAWCFYRGRCGGHRLDSVSSQIGCRTIHLDTYHLTHILTVSRYSIFPFSLLPKTSPRTRRHRHIWGGSIGLWRTWNSENGETGQLN